MRAAWVGLILLAVVTVAFAPNIPPARPEPGAEKIIRAVFEGQA